jgi:hypothetical protein
MMRPNMNDPRALALFKEVLKQTQAGKLPWQPAPEEGFFVAPVFDKYLLTLRPYTTKDNWGNPDDETPSLLLDDENRDTLIEITHEIDGVGASDLRTLAVFAKRTALNTDEKIDEVLGLLKKREG